MRVARIVTNSRESRVRPTFGWLQANGGDSWPQRLVDLAQGLKKAPTCGRPLQVFLDPERQVPPRPERLIWMLRNVARLAPQDGSNWRVLSSRVADQQSVADAILALESGHRSRVPKNLILEGSTHADCLIECEQSFVWIEGKRFDWLSPSIKWDVTRDQLARNVEAVWSLAAEAGKDFCVIVCHEGQLKHHEQLLIDGYRNQTWSAGWPHVDASTRDLFADRIGTLTWLRIAQEWPQIRLDGMFA